MSSAYFNRPNIDLSPNKIADAARALRKTTEEIASEIEQSGKVVLLDFARVQARPENVDAFLDAMRAAGLYVVRQESMVFIWGKKADPFFGPPKLEPMARGLDPMLQHEWIPHGRDFS